MRIGTKFVFDAEKRHQRFILVGGLNSLETMQWLARYANPAFTVRVIGDFRDILVIEFQPRAAIQGQGSGASF